MRAVKMRGGGELHIRGGEVLTCLERLKMAVGLAGLPWREAVFMEGGSRPSRGSSSSGLNTGKLA